MCCSGRRHFADGRSDSSTNRPRLVPFAYALACHHVLHLHACRGQPGPFDLAEAESELVGGWHRVLLHEVGFLFLAEYIHVFVGSAFFAVIFMGGWSVNPLPFGPDLPDVNPASWGALGAILLPLIQFGVLMGKVVLMVALTMMVRWTLPASD